MSTGNSTTRQHAHHFNSADHEFKSSILGVWVFLATEILMFGGLFVAYIIFQSKFPEMFIEGAKYLDWRYGAVNTVVLLFSSYTMVMGVHYAKKGNASKTVLSLAITLLCGVGFMVIKYLEYSHKFDLGIYPGKYFALEGAEAANLSMYFSLYFGMTALHGSHVIIGMLLILWVLLRARKNEFSAEYFTPVEGVGLFWHLVDMIWIYLFPLLYLI